MCVSILLCLIFKRLSKTIQGAKWECFGQPCKLSSLDFSAFCLDIGTWVSLVVVLSWKFLLSIQFVSLSRRFTAFFTFVDLFLDESKRNPEFKLVTQANRSRTQRTGEVQESEYILLKVLRVKVRRPNKNKRHFVKVTRSWEEFINEWR